MPLNPPPELPPFETFDHLLSVINIFAKSEGYAIIKRRPCNYRDGVPRRWDLTCNSGGRTPHSRSRGLRKTKSTKTECPWKAKAIQRVSLQDRWTLELQDTTHNHPPAEKTGHDIAHRRRTWTEKQRETLRDKIMQGMRGRAIASEMAKEFPDQVWDRRDIENEKASMRKEGIDV